MARDTDANRDLVVAVVEDGAVDVSATFAADVASFVADH